MSAEKSSGDKVANLKGDIEQAQLDIDKAQQQADWNKVAELQHGRLPQLQKELGELQQDLDSGETATTNEVKEDDIAEIVARWTNKDGIEGKAKVSDRIGKIIDFNVYQCQ